MLQQRTSTMLALVTSLLLLLLLPMLLLFARPAMSMDDNYEEYYKSVELAYENKQLANEHHKMAMKRINKGDYGGSLPYFRLACRLSPTNVAFWNDLGVTEMRVGMLQKAKRRFLTAIDINPKFATSHENLREIKQFLEPEAFAEGGAGGKKSLKAAFEHTLLEPLEMSAAELAGLTLQSDQRDADILGKGPIVVRRAAQQWGWDLSKFSFRSLDTNFSSERVDYYPHNMQDESVHPFFTSLGEALRTLQSPQSVYLDVDVSEPGTYIQWNVREKTWRDILRLANATLPPVFDDAHWTGGCLDAEEQEQFNHNVHWKMMLIGEQGAGMFNHKDVLRMASWQVQVTGRKKWHMCSNTQDAFLSVHTDTLYPDYIRWPQLRNATCYMTTISAGDVLYYPRDWWHQTENLETPSVALSGSTVSHHNHKEFAESLRKQCLPGGGNVFAPTEQACAAVERCEEVWAGMYGGAGAGGEKDEL